MSRIGLLLHLHQSPIQKESTLREITEQCYIPLVKFIKNAKKFNLSLSISLSLLEQLDNLGYTSLIKGIKELVEEEKINLVGTAAYDPFLTLLPQDFVERQVILNEYALGYYFGKKGGFEGDPSIMLQNVIGFYTPNINEELVKILSELNYIWLLTEGPFSENFGIFNLKNYETKLIATNSKVSKLIQNSKDYNVSEILNAIKREKQEFAISLRGELFGYENKFGIEMLEDLVKALAKEDSYFVTVDTYISRANEATISEVTERDIKIENKKLLKVQRELTKKYEFGANILEETGFEEFPFWIEEELIKVEDADLRKKLELELLANKVLCSEQFLLGSKDAKPYIDMYKELAEAIGDENFIQLVKEYES